MGEDKATSEEAMADVGPQGLLSIYDFDEEDEGILEVSIKRARKFERLHPSSSSRSRKKTRKRRPMVAIYERTRRKSRKRSHKGRTKKDLSPNDLVDLTADGETELDSCDQTCESYIGVSPMSADDSGLGCLAEKYEEVVVETEELFFAEAFPSRLACLKFTVDSVKLEVLESLEKDKTIAKSFQWDLNQISSFESYTNQTAVHMLLQFGFVKHWYSVCCPRFTILKAAFGVLSSSPQTLLLAMHFLSLEWFVAVHASFNKLGGYTDFDFNHGCKILLKLNPDCWLEQCRQITALADHYKLLYKPLHEDKDRGKIHEFRLRTFSEQNAVNKESWASIEISPSQPKKDKRIHVVNKPGLKDWVDIVYPREDPDAVIITKSDFLLLKPMEFLSDTLIDFYVKYLQSSLPEGVKEKLYFFNSFFFRKLAEQECSIQDEPQKRKTVFDGVRRWTAKVDIFEKDFLFIPIMQSSHWSLVIVCYPRPRITVSGVSEKSIMSCILHLDSMEGSHTNIEKPIKDYLVEAWIDKYQEDSDLLNYACQHISQMEFRVVEAPQQTNLFDCGLFLLHYVELFIKQIDNFPHFMNMQWFNPSDVSAKRAHIRELITGLQLEISMDKEPLQEYSGVPIHEESRERSPSPSLERSLKDIHSISLNSSNKAPFSTKHVELTTLSESSNLEFCHGNGPLSMDKEMCFDSQSETQLFTQVLTPNEDRPDLCRDSISSWVSANGNPPDEREKEDSSSIERSKSRLHDVEDKQDGKKATTSESHHGICVLSDSEEKADGLHMSVKDIHTLGKVKNSAHEEAYRLSLLTSDEEFENFEAPNRGEKHCIVSDDDDEKQTCRKSGKRRRKLCKVWEVSTPSSQLQGRRPITRSGKKRRGKAEKALAVDSVSFCELDMSL